MSWSKQVTIWCDGDNCGNWDQVSTGSVKKAVNTVKKYEGWTVKEGKHYCKECSEEMINEKT